MEITPESLEKEPHSISFLKTGRKRQLQKGKFPPLQTIQNRQADKQKFNINCALTYDLKFCMQVFIPTDAYSMWGGNTSVSGVTRAQGQATKSVEICKPLDRGHVKVQEVGSVRQGHHFCAI